MRLSLKNSRAEDTFNFLAGFPGDRHGDSNTDSALKINSSDRYSLESGVQIDHYISNFEGSSGSPIFAMYYRNAIGDLKPIDREFMRKLPIGFDPNKVESVLVAMNKKENSELGYNKAKFMNDDSIMDYVFDDTSRK
ncbi:MAG: hypothetical protein IPP41_07435 [Rhodocyclaceae bacterium]|nr:hypothetical protein [Rhodocyclaceae bacterium]